MLSLRLPYFVRLLLTLIPGIFLIGCQGRNEFIPPPPPQVTVAKPVQEKVTDYIEFTGHTRAVEKVELVARVSGYLKKIAFKDGATVQKGDLLFLIDQAPLKAELKAANARVEKAKAELALANANVKRLEELVAKNAVSAQEMDVEKAKQETTSAELKAAEAAVDTAQLNLDYTEIRAPITGRIGMHLVDVGNLVKAEQTLMAKIESIDPIHAYFHVSEADLLRYYMESMAHQKKLPIPEKERPELYLGLGNGSGFPFKGHVDFQELGVDPGTGTVLRRGVFPNPDLSLVPGMFVRIKAPIGEPALHILVEERAIGKDQRGDYVLVVNGKKEVEYRPVQLGITVGEMRVIEKGIGLDDWVIINGLQRARPGAKVNPQEAKMTTPKMDSSWQAPNGQ